MKKLNKSYLVLIVVLLIIGGYFMVHGDTYKADVATINAHPAILSKKHIEKGKLDGLKISNAHIVGMVMEDVDAERAEIKNITFENCTFTRVFLYDSHFENVAFKNCNIQNKGNPEELLNNTIFARSVMKNVLFENTRLHHVDITDVDGEGGYVFFRNMRDVYPPGGVGNILSGVDMHFRIVNSEINQAYFNVLDEDKNSFYAKYSKFKDPFIKSDLLYMENCDARKGSLTAYKNMVVKNTTVNRISFVPHQKAYLLNNIYENLEKDTLDTRGRIKKSVYLNSRLLGYPDSHTYILQQGKQKELARLNFEEGNVTIQNVRFYDADFDPALGSRMPSLGELNLRNVEILNWSDWSKRNILGGKWENVKIHGPILVRDTKIENVQVYNLAFPKGEPWEKEGDFVFDVTKSSKPFEWEEIKVPTPEELGLEWWPMEPGYHPEK